MRMILSLLLLLSLSAKSQSVTTTANASSWKKYEDPAYTIDHPSDWTVKLPDAATPYLYFFSPRVSADDKFAENVNISHQSIAGLNLTMDSLVSATAIQVKSLITNGKILESKRLQGKSGAYHKMIYTGDMGQFSLSFEQYFFLAGDDVYVVTFTSEQDQFDSYKQTAERILDSFLLKREAL